MQLRTIKARRPRRFRVDDYQPEEDPDRQQRIEAHRQRIQRELKRHRN